MKLTTPILQVFDPAMCCSSGACGPNVDTKLVQFAADLDWLKTRDVIVQRHNLSQSPAAFVENETVKSTLTNPGEAALPVFLANGKVVATVPIGQGVDANAYDPGTQYAFSSNGEGNVTIAHEEAPDKLTPVQSLATEKGARTMALDPTTHKIYLATAKFEPAPEQAPGAPRQRPKMIPGTFKILVYGM